MTRNDGHATQRKHQDTNYASARASSQRRRHLCRSGARLQPGLKRPQPLREPLRLRRAAPRRFRRSALGAFQGAAALLSGDF